MSQSSRSPQEIGFERFNEVLDELKDLERVEVGSMLIYKGNHAELGTIVLANAMCGHFAMIMK